MANLPPVPPILKSIRPYVKVSLELSKRDPIVSYYCDFYALQAALKTNYKSSAEAKQYLVKLMDYVEQQKEVLKNNPEHNETVSSEIAAYAVVESAALKLFNWADTQDRASVFNKSVVKSFYTASILFDVLEVFEDGLSDDIKMQRKYARWKATYIHNCLKNNQAPTPGPVGGLGEDEQDDSNTNIPQSLNDPRGGGADFPSSSVSAPAATPGISAFPQPAPRSTQPEPPSHLDDKPSDNVVTSASPQDLREAEKLCKYAASALQYDDVATAIQNLEKCLRLLRSSQA